MGNRRESDLPPSLIEAADFKVIKIQIIRYGFTGDFKICAEILGGGRSRLPHDRGSHCGPNGAVDLLRNSSGRAGADQSGLFF
jgi:hypothetical protein